MKKPRFKQLIQQSSLSTEVFSEIIATRPHMNYGKENQIMQNISKSSEENVISKEKIKIWVSLNHVLMKVSLLVTHAKERPINAII